MSKQIIHFSGDDYWNSYPHSRFHIVKAWHKLGYKILWLNPVGHRFPSFRKKIGFWGKIGRKLKSLLKFLKKVDENFYVYTPLLLPKFKVGFSRKINSFLLRFQVNVTKLLLGIRNPIFFISTPIFSDAIKISHHKLIYYYSDRYIAYRDFSAENKKFMKILDEQLYLNADLICCASNKIYEEVKSLTSQKVIYTPHVVDFKLFNNSLEDKYIPQDIETIAKPIIGYYGTLTKSFDWEIIEYCAIERPNYNFVLIGRDDLNEVRLKNLKNIYLLGKKDFQDIPHYGKMFDICLSPFRKGEWINNSSPLKIKEYLSLEKPVISSDIEEVTKLYPEIVYIGKSKLEFLQIIDKNVDQKEIERIKKGKDLVKSDSWENVSKTIIKNLNSK